MQQLRGRLTCKAKLLLSFVSHGLLHTVVIEQELFIGLAHRKQGVSHKFFHCINRLQQLLCNPLCHTSDVLKKRGKNYSVFVTLLR